MIIDCNICNMECSLSKTLANMAICNIQATIVMDPGRQARQSHYV